MNKIHFTFFAQAYFVDSVWGFGCPSGGIKNLGNLCHKHGIPVTWLVSPKSARCEMEMFTEFHEKYGDEIALFLRFPAGPEVHHTSEREIAQKMSIDELREVIQQQKQQILEYLPWASIKVAGQGIRTPNLMEALKLEGIIGMFGHCYCQIGTDSITDFGMPWGSFNMRPESAHLPARENESGLVTFEWTMRDLNRSFHTTRPELWSTDPNDVERGGVCSDTNVEYWKGLFQQYQRALPLNEQGIWFQFHQEAHEQTWGEVCKPFTESRVEFCTKMMDLFFEWLKQQDDVEFMTATEAALLYLQSQPKGTLPMYIPYKWVSVPSEMAFWEQVRTKSHYSGNIHKNAHIPVDFLYDYLQSVNDADPIQAMLNPPWSDSFFYFDQDCQLIFDQNRTHPVAVFNYINFEPDEDLLDMENEVGGGALGFFLEPEVPIPEIKIDLSSSPKIFEFDVMNPHEKEYPYGLFLWEKKYPGIVKYFEFISQNDDRNELTIKISPDQGVFLRCNLSPGKNSYLF